MTSKRTTPGSWTLERAFALAMDHHRAGRFADAERLYRLILAKLPDQPDALHLLGLNLYTAFILAFVLLILGAGWGMYLLARDSFGADRPGARARQPVERQAVVRHRRRRPGRGCASDADSRVSVPRNT